MVPLTDAYALRGVARYGLNYGPLRLWGSVAFVLGALACGVLVDVIAARHLIWVIAAMAGLGAVLGLGLRPLDQPKTAPVVASPREALLRDPGFVAIILASALIQGSHAAYYTFGSITWQASGLSGADHRRPVGARRDRRNRGVRAVAAIYAGAGAAGGDRGAQRGRALDD